MWWQMQQSVVMSLLVLQSASQSLRAAAALCKPVQMRCRRSRLTKPTQHIGGLGLGQLTNFVLVGLTWVPGAVLIMLLVFSIGSPAQDRDWACSDAADAPCVAALTAPDPGAALCGLERSQWRWTQPHATLTGQFDLVCGGE